MNKYIVTKIIEVEADSPEEAVGKAAQGKTVSISAAAPRQPQQMMMPPGAARPPGSM